MDKKKEKCGKILSVEDLAVHYVTDDERVCALNGVSFSLNYGETIGLVGGTGAGKTTIARTIMRTLPHPPAQVQGGTIRFYDADRPDGKDADGIDLLHAEEAQMRQIRGAKISMVFQDPMTALNPVMRVGRQIAEGIKIHEGLSWKEAERKAMEMLELVGIPSSRFREFPHQFSGGMKQRVVIAIALACSPDLLIADEPTTALDVTIQAQVLEMIKKLQREKNTALILITHDFGVIAENCDNVAVVYAGQIVEYGSRDQVFRNPKHPYTRGLFDAIPSTSSKDLDRLNAIAGAPPDPTHLPEGCYFSPRCAYASQECIRCQSVPNYVLADGHQCRCLLCAGEAEAAL